MNKIKQLLGASALAAGLAFASGASAGIIPYPGGGENLATYTFLSTGAGDITAYFAGSDAALEENIGLYIDGVSTGITGLNNHTSAIGDSVVLGTATGAGQVLTFVMYIPPAVGAPLPAPMWWSDPSSNSDGAQHVYSTNAALGQVYLNSPVGTYVGWEDLPKGSADFDYNDDQYIFTGVTSSVPELSTWGMMVAGFGGLGLAAFRRARKTSVSAFA